MQALLAPSLLLVIQVLHGIPAALTHIEEAAEDAYDKALVSDYGAVADDAQALASDWASFRGQAEADGAAPSDLAAMDAAIACLSQAVADEAHRTPLSLAHAANAVSGPMDELFALYNDPVPPEILALDYGGREVSLDARAHDMAAARADLDELESVWSRVRRRVKVAGGGVEAARYEASLARQRRRIAAGDAKGLRKESNAGLEIVDELERVFGD